jgi:hypothetical protein
MRLACRTSLSAEWALSCFRAREHESKKERRSAKKNERGKKRKRQPKDKNANLRFSWSLPWGGAEFN